MIDAGGNPAPVRAKVGSDGRIVLPDLAFPLGARVVVTLDDGPLSVVERLATLCAARGEPPARAWLEKPFAIEVNGARHVCGSDGAGLCGLLSDEPAAESGQAEALADALFAAQEVTLPLDLAALRRWLGEPREARELCSCDNNRRRPCEKGCDRGMVPHGCRCDECPVKPVPCGYCGGLGTIPCKKCDDNRSVAIEPSAVRVGKVPIAVGLSGRSINAELALRFLAPLEGAARISLGCKQTDPLIVLAENGFAVLMPMSNRAAYNYSIGGA